MKLPANEGLAAQRIRESIAVKQDILKDSGYTATIQMVAAKMAEALQSGRKVLFMGNGGSAADAQHLAAEFVGRYLRERTPLAAMALTVNTSSLTAIANDYSYEIIFARQVEALGGAGDIAVGLSTSGNSKNVLRGMEAARQKGMLTVAMTGKGGGLLKDAVDFCFCVPTCDTPRIQEAHILTGHILCEIVENEIFG